MYMGGVPMAEHVTWLPGSTLTAASTILGGTGEVMFEFSYYCNIYLLSAWEGQTGNPMLLPTCSLTEPYLLTLTLNKAHLAVIHATTTSECGLS